MYVCSGFCHLGYIYRDVKIDLCNITSQGIGDDLNAVCFMC